MSELNQLKKDAARCKRVRYSRPLSELATLYEASERTLKKWIRAGKQVADLPPLDEPALMGAWWLRVMTYRMPDKLLALAQVKTGDNGAPASDSALTDLPPATPAEILRSANEFVTIAQARLRAAIASDDDFKIKLRKTDLNTALDSLTKARAHFDATQAGAHTPLTQADIDGQIAVFMDRLAVVLGKDLSRQFTRDCLNCAAAAGDAKEWDRRRHAITRAAPWIAEALGRLVERIATGLGLFCNHAETREAGRKHAAEMLAALAYEQKIRIERRKLP